MSKLNLGSDLNIRGKLGVTHILSPGETVFDIQGSAGQLFSITDSLEGDLFSVNDISGLPIFTVNSNDYVTINGITNSDSFVKSGGLATEFLKADGSVDNNLYPPLTNGIIPEQYLPDSVLGKVEYIGTWNAATNTPDIGLASDSKGHYYIVTTTGTFETVTYNVGDWIISNGTTWEKVDNTESVVDVFGRTGQIVAQEADYEAFYPKLSSTYTNPSWITSLPWSKITATPTTLAGYGITDAFTETEADDRYVNISGDTMTGKLISTNPNPFYSKVTDGYTFVFHRPVSANSNRFFITPSGSINGEDFLWGNSLEFNTEGFLTVNKVIKRGGTASQFLKADGSVDSNTYALSSALTSHNHDADYVKKSGDTMTGALIVQNKLSQADILQSGYVESNPINFRFDQDSLRYVNRWGTATINAPQFTNSEIDNLFSKYASSVNLNGKTSPATIEVDGLNIGSTANSQFYPFTYMHAGTVSIQNLKMELKKNGIWETNYDGTLEQYILSKNSSTGANLNGVRWTFTFTQATNIYIRSLGCVSRNGDAYQWNVMKGGDTMYGNLTLSYGGKFILKDGTTSQFLKANGDVDSTSYYHSGNLTNINQITSRSYNDLQDKPALNITDWNTTFAWGNFRDYGLGITTAQGVGIPGGNLNSITIPNGLYKITISTLNSPVGGEAGTVIVERSGLDNYITQKAHIVNAGDISRAYIRHYKPASSTWTPWRRLWTTEDFTSTNVGNWNNAYSWGDHADAGYLTSTPDYSGVYEPVISPKGSAFNKNFGFVAGTVAQGDDYRLNNGETAFGWGDHSLGGYLTPSTGDAAYVNKTGDTMSGNLIVPTLNIGSINSYIRTYGGADTDITSLIPGSAFGTLFKGENSGHIVFKIDGNDNNDSFNIVSHSTTSDTTNDKPTDKLLLKIKRDGETTINGNLTALSFVKSGGLPTEFLKADGTVDSSTYITGITVTDDNASITRNQIATVEGTPLFETVGEMLQPTLDGNILNVRFKDGDGVIQSQPVDLSNLAAFNNTVSNATYNASTNIITLTETDGGTYEIDLSEFSILTATDANGITTLKQEIDGLGDPILKLTVSKVGQSGEWNDVLNKPTTFPPSTHNHNAEYVNVTGDTMTGNLEVPYLKVKSSSDQKLVLQATDSVGTAGVSDGAWNYIGFLDAEGDRQGYFGIDPNGHFVFNAEVSGAEVRLNTNLRNSQAIYSSSFIKSGGTSTQFLKADGTVDSNTYALSSTLTEHDHDADYVNVTGDTMTGDLNINAKLKINTGNATGLVADTVITTLPVATNEAAFFDYVIKREDGLGLRAGTIMAVWDGANVEYNDTSTKDLGGITDLIDLSVDILTGEVRLVATITGGTWTVKAGTRVL